MSQFSSVRKRSSPFDATDEVVDDYSIRCPRCREVFPVHEMECPKLFDEGCHVASCSHCELDFEIQTRVTYHFRSPALKPSDDQ